MDEEEGREDEDDDDDDDDDEDGIDGIEGKCRTESVSPLRNEATIFPVAPSIARTRVKVKTKASLG